MRRKTHALAVGGLVVTAALLFSGCAASDPEDGGTDAGSDPIKIGFLGPLSGPAATYGVPGLSAAEMAVEQVNESGVLGREIELVALDDRADATTSATLAQQLVTQEEVIAVIGGVNSGTTQAHNPILTGAGVVQLLIGAQAPAFTAPDAPGYPLTFRIGEHTLYDVEAVLHYFEDGGFERICTVADTSAFGQSAVDAVRAVFADNGMSIHREVTHAPNAPDLTSIVLQLRDADCDAVYLWSQNADSGTFMKTLSTLAWDVPVIGARGLGVGAFITTIDSSMDGLIFPTLVDRNRPEAVAFIDAFDERFGADADPAHFMSAMGHDAVLFLAAALAETGGEGGAALAEALENTTIENGVMGRAGTTLWFTPEAHDVQSEELILSFLEVVDGELVQVDPALAN